MNRITTYLQESFDEFAKKATWPTFAELQKTTVLVIVASIIFALIIFGMDKVITAFLEVLYQLF